MEGTKDYDHLIDRIYTYNEAIAKRLKYRGIDDNEIPDLAVKIMLDAVASVQQLREDDKLKPWVMKIADNSCNQYLKERAVRWDRELSYVKDMETGEEIDIYDVIADEMTVEKVIKIAEEMKVLEDLLENLKPEENKIFLLHNLEGYKFREIAEMLGINDSTVRSHHRRAVIKMETCLDKLRRKEEKHD